MRSAVKERHWSTLYAGRENAVRYWQQAHLEAFFEMDVAIDREDGFNGSIDQQACGPISFSKLKLNSPQRLSRSRKAIAHCNRLHFEFIAMTQAQMLLCQNGKEIVINAGESVLVDNRIPYSIASLAATKCLVYHVPIDWMNLWVPSSNELCARVIRPDTPWGRVVNTMSLELAEAASSLGEVKTQICAEQLASAIAIALTENSDRAVHGVGTAHYRRALDALHSHAHEVGLSPQALARRLRISVRYLHKIFAAQGTTFSKELSSIRLDRAKTMLANITFASLSVAEIGWRAGFTDSSHFSRSFRERYGKPPGLYRTSR